jgi:hypothetical protein
VGHDDGARRCLDGDRQWLLAEIRSKGDERPAPFADVKRQAVELLDTDE